MAESAEQALYDALSQGYNSRAQAVAVSAVAQEIARDEIASFCGLVLRRLQDSVTTDDGMTVDGHVLVSELSAIFGEALRDFGGTELEPGNDKGD